MVHIIEKNMKPYRLGRKHEPNRLGGSISEEGWGREVGAGWEGVYGEGVPYLK